MKKLSKGEEEFALYCRSEHLVPEREYRFHPNRRWRFDFAFPDEMLAVEIEGGIWTGGRHGRGAGFEKDCEKYNHAAIMGWTVLRYSTQMVMDGTAINDVLEVIGR
jgi:very-short-patch-repair endonuclease